MLRAIFFSPNDLESNIYFLLAVNFSRTVCFLSVFPSLYTTDIFNLFLTTLSSAECITEASWFSKFWLDSTNQRTIKRKRLKQHGQYSWFLHAHLLSSHSVSKCALTLHSTSGQKAAWRLQMTEGLVCIIFMGTSQSSHKFPARLWGHLFPCRIENC